MGCELRTYGSFFVFDCTLGGLNFYGGLNYELSPIFS